MADLALLFGALVVLLATGMPIFLAMGGASLAYALLAGGVPGVVLAQSLVQGVNSYVFVAVPFFFLAGEIIARSGIGDRLFRLAGALVGHRPGGLGHVNVLTNLTFAGVSGSAVADAAAVTSILAPPMRRQGYPPAYIAALTAAGATLGPILPPSIPMLIYALFTGASVAQLFMAGLVPAALMAAGLLLVGARAARRQGFPVGPRADWAEVGRAATAAAWGLAMPVIVLAGLRFGLATATEIGALLVVYAAAVGALVHRSLTASDLAAAVAKAARDAAALLVIVASAGAFVWILATAGLGETVAGLVLASGLSGWGVMLLVVALTLALGTVLDPVTLLVLLGPLLLPAVGAVGVDPVQFGVVLILASVLGLLTPPVGVLLYLVSAQIGVSPVAVIRQIGPFLAVLVLVLVLVALVPALTVGAAGWILGT